MAVSAAQRRCSAWLPERQQRTWAVQLGKSHLSLYVASQVSVGAAFPDGEQARQGNVLIATAEDGLAVTVRPRLDAYGADTSRVFFLTGVKIYVDEVPAERGFCLHDDLSRLETVIDERDIDLAIIDPLNAYLAGVDSHKAAEVRAALAPLAAMAERTGVAVLVILHLNKSTGGNALYRASGSLDFVAAARSVLGVAEDPDHEGRRLLLPVKLNLAAKPEGIGFCITDEGVEFDYEAVTIDAAAAFGVKQRADSEPMSEAKEFLERVLASGVPYPSKVIFEEAKEEGISRATLWRAKKALGVKASRQGGLGKEGAWHWQLLSDADAGDEEGFPF